MKTILIVDDDPLILKTLSTHFSKSGYEVLTADDGKEGLQRYSESMPDLVILDIRLPDLDGLEALRRIRDIDPKAIVIIITAYDDMKTTVEAIKSGAFEYLVKPLDFLELDLTINKAFQISKLEDKLHYLMEEKQREYTIDNIIGRSPQMREVFKLIGSVVNNRANILIQGESGTGKELCAKAIHYNSANRDEPFIVINCSAIQDTLLESELFGHVKGAFTDAVQETKGKFEIAGKGSLFLDEIGDVSPNLQSKLLRVIENRDFMKVVEIKLPSLRERKEDVPELVGYLLEKINRELRKNVRKVPEHVMKKLIDWPWDGNVRELENALTHAVILAKGDIILEESLPLEAGDKKPYPQKLVALKEVEKNYIQHVLQIAKGSKTQASQILGISRPTLDKKIRDYQLDV